MYSLLAKRPVCSIGMRRFLLDVELEIRERVNQLPSIGEISYGIECAESSSNEVIKRFVVFSFALLFSVCNAKVTSAAWQRKESNVIYQKRTGWSAVREFFLARVNPFGRNADRTWKLAQSHSEPSSKNHNDLFRNSFYHSWSVPPSWIGHLSIISCAFYAI